MNNLHNSSFIVLAIFFQSSGGIFGKYAALSLGAPTIIGIVTNIFYILALLCMVLQAIVWQQALMHYSLSFAYPFMSLFNFIILVASAILFHEGITLANVIGLIFISVGITVASSKYGGFLCSSL